MIAQLASGQTLQLSEVKQVNPVWEDGIANSDDCAPRHQLVSMDSTEGKLDLHSADQVHHLHGLF